MVIKSLCFVFMGSTDSSVGFSTTMSLYENNGSNKTNIDNHKTI